jgi:hypothetical protein
MKKIWTLLFAATAVVLTACGENNQAASHDEHTTTTTTTDQAQSTGSVRIKDDQLNAVYQHYIHLTTALTNSDEAEAKVAANAIEAGAKDLQNGNAIATAASKITNAQGIEAQRAAYEDLSMQMISRLKSAGVENGELYVQHCPMAFDDKGASWVSSQKEIRNPYFGDKMMKCGETQETIK